MESGLGILILIGSVLIYFLPTIIAVRRKHKKNENSIILLNLLLGWTFIGWIVALIWAVADEAPIKPTVINQSSSSADQLLKLNEAKEKGLLTEEEFLIEKKKILAK